jgi:hypothetical protein
MWLKILGTGVIKLRHPPKILTLACFLFALHLSLSKLYVLFSRFAPTLPLAFHQCARVLEISSTRVSALITVSSSSRNWVIISTQKPYQHTYEVTRW